MIPYTFTITSHLFITFSLGMMMFTAVIVVGFRTHGLHFFALFCPAGIPLAIAPLLIAIELVSFCFKVISISVRLFANVMAGHALFKILASVHCVPSGLPCIRRSINDLIVRILRSADAA
jgi:ATP synthase subunit 6